jgi:hypothetical protein
MSQPRAALGNSARTRAALACIALLFGGCLDNKLPPDEAMGTSHAFLALDRDFADFRDWMPFELDAKSHAAAKGPVVVYLNDLPPADATQFPVGTLIVKTVEAGAPSTWTIHAMSKRGGDFNARGALGWEFFELKIDKDDIPVIVWRGEKPADGHKYKDLTGDNKTEQDCNDCHQSSKNDAVLAPELDLSTLR